MNKRSPRDPKNRPSIICYSDYSDLATEDRQKITDFLEELSKLTYKDFPIESKETIIYDMAEWLNMGEKEKQRISEGYNIKLKNL